MEEEKKVVKKTGPVLYVELLAPDAKAPVKSNPTDSGFDVYAHSFKKLYQNFGGNGERVLEDKLLANFVRDKTITLTYLERVLIGTGIKATCGAGYEIQARPRSGLALKNGLTVINTPGTIDEGYRHEIGIIVVNLSRKEQVITLDTRIAQLIVAPVALPEIKIVSSLPEPYDEDRGGGFGHTGTK